MLFHQGTPALYLLLLLYNSSMLSAYMEDERLVSWFFVYRRYQCGLVYCVHTKFTAIWMALVV